MGIAKFTHTGVVGGRPAKIAAAIVDFPPPLAALRPHTVGDDRVAQGKIAFVVDCAAIPGCVVGERAISHGQLTVVVNGSTLKRTVVADKGGIGQGHNTSGSDGTSSSAGGTFPVGGVVVEEAAFDVQGSRCCDCAAFSANIGGKFTIFNHGGPAVTYSSAPSDITNISEHKAVGYCQNPGYIIPYPSPATPVIIYYLAL